MDDVTDTVFRRIVAQCAKPDLYFTEFASVDGFQSVGRAAVEKKLRFRTSEKPLIAQLWGTKPENFYMTAKELALRGYAGIDLNMGCPVKNVIRLGACSALMSNHELAGEIIRKTMQGAGNLPVSIKTRIGTKNYDETWFRFLLKHKPAALTIHFRSVSELSGVSADWELAKRIVALRDELAPGTILVGNGDVLTRFQGEELAERYLLDGIMIGRGIFQDPFVFSRNSPWPNMSADQRIALYSSHVKLFRNEWGVHKNHAVLKRFAKVYINGFDGAKDLRERLMNVSDTKEMLDVLKSPIMLK